MPYEILLKYLTPHLMWLILVITSIYLAYLYLTRDHGYWRDRGVPHEEPYFLAGNLWEVFKGERQIGKHLGALYKKYKSPYFGIYIMGKPYLVLRSPELIKNITIRDFHNFDDRTFACDEKADAMSANSLFILRNPEWRNIRNKLTSIFTSGKLKLMFPIMRTAGLQMTNYLKKNVDQTLEIKDLSAKYMTDLVASAFFGIEIDSFCEEESDFRIASREMFEMDFYTSFSMFSYFFVPKLVSLFKLKLLDTQFLQAAFRNTLHHRETTNTKRNDFVDLLLSLRNNFAENGTTKFDNDSMVAQGITFFVAGFETTSNLLAFALYELCLHPKCQDRLREEIFQCIKSDDDINFDTIQQMQYLEMITSETLRRYPFGPFLNRRCKEDYLIEETGLIIEKGTPVLIPIDGIHNDPEYYPNPDTFDPERFANGNKPFAQACKYLPFGSGPRNCIGDRFGLICAKVGLIYFLTRFKVEACAATPKKLVLNPKSPFIVPIEGLPMRIRSLNQT